MIRALARTPANNIWKLYAVRLIFWMHFISAVLIPFYRDWGSISFTQIFFLNAWFMLCNFFLEVPTGTIADVTQPYTIIDFDKGGRKKFVTSMVQLEATSVEAPTKPASKSRAKKAKTAK